MPQQRRAWLRRLAVQLAAQLPEEREDAQDVIILLRELVDGFMFADSDGRRLPLNLVREGLAGAFGPTDRNGSRGV